MTVLSEYKIPPPHPTPQSQTASGVSAKAEREKCPKSGEPIETPSPPVPERGKGINARIE